MNHRHKRHTQRHYVIPYRVHLLLKVRTFSSRPLGKSSIHPHGLPHEYTLWQFHMLLLPRTLLFRHKWLTIWTLTKHWILHSFWRRSSLLVQYQNESYSIDTEASSLQWASIKQSPTLVASWRRWIQHMISTFNLKLILDYKTSIDLL